MQMWSFAHSARALTEDWLVQAGLTELRRDTLDVQDEIYNIEGCMAMLGPSEQSTLSGVWIEALRTRYDATTPERMRLKELYAAQHHSGGPSWEEWLNNPNTGMYMIVLYLLLLSSLIPSAYCFAWVVRA